MTMVLNSCQKSWICSSGDLVLTSLQFNVQLSLERRGGRLNRVMMEIIAARLVKGKPIADAVRTVL